MLRDRQLHEGVATDVATADNGVEPIVHRQHSTVQLEKGSLAIEAGPAKHLVWVTVPINMHYRPPYDDLIR